MDPDGGDPPLFSADSPVGDSDPTLAERGGFEPPVSVTQYNDLANRRLRPLGHLSRSRKHVGDGPDLLIRFRLFSYQETGGGGGIRTPGDLRHGGFQDRCLRPLGHSSRGAPGGKRTQYRDRQALVKPDRAGFTGPPRR